MIDNIFDKIQKIEDDSNLKKVNNHQKIVKETTKRND